MIQLQDRHTGARYRKRTRLMAFHGVAFPNRRLQRIVLVAFLLCFGGCLPDSKDKALGHGHDFGANDSNLVLCMGDSITAGGFSGGAPWPARFSVMTGKTTINAGIPGAQSSAGVAQIQTNLAAYRPGFVIIFYGANDAIQGIAPATTGENVRRMIRAAKANQAIPVIANVLPMTGYREVYNPRVNMINSIIADITREEDVTRVNLNAAVRTDPDSLFVDGLHLNQLGETFVAMEFMDVF